ncbi:PaaI family thioesterase [Vibrio panuliri]|uniref:Acyl-coenzyme A thioesterase THEM4 n=1 Tax=Vibrio panuliri TaxID=1381081 RepID=A0ABX3FN17_9VIBR|nr:PaaI family thioesterase [Vibrio panuliri]KAB1457914.1 PaaI family thioesterase [Vibrio panuliri]OLQ95616.1 thioesterase [Vibrio panuliri]
MSVQIPRNHAQCVICQQPFFTDHVIEFQPTAQGVVRAEIVATSQVQGYVGVMQGGLVTALHDSAMLHCLFAEGVTAMTAKLETRFHHPVPIGETLIVEAKHVMSKRNVHYLQSEVRCGETLCSSAKSQFISIS